MHLALPRRNSSPPSPPVHVRSSAKAAAVSHLKLLLHHPQMRPYPPKTSFLLQQFQTGYARPLA